LTIFAKHLFDQRFQKLSEHHEENNQETKTDPLPLFWPSLNGYYFWNRRWVYQSFWNITEFEGCLVAPSMRNHTHGLVLHAKNCIVTLKDW